MSKVFVLKKIIDLGYDGELYNNIGVFTSYKKAKEYIYTIVYNSIKESGYKGQIDIILNNKYNHLYEIRLKKYGLIPMESVFENLFYIEEFDLK